MRTKHLHLESFTDKFIKADSNTYFHVNNITREIDYTQIHGTYMHLMSDSFILIKNDDDDNFEINDLQIILPAEFYTYLLKGAKWMESMINDILNFQGNGQYVNKALSIDGKEFFFVKKEVRGASRNELNGIYLYLDNMGVFFYPDETIGLNTSTTPLEITKEEFCLNLLNAIKQTKNYIPNGYVDNKYEEHM